MGLGTRERKGHAMELLWPYVVIYACLTTSPATCDHFYLPVNIEDRGLVGPAAAGLTCQKTSFRTAFMWEQEHPRWRMKSVSCEDLNPDTIPKQS